MKTILAAMLLCGVSAAAIGAESQSKRDAFLSSFRWAMQDAERLGAQPSKNCDQVKCWSVMAMREPQFDGSWGMTSLTTETYFSGAERRLRCDWGALHHPDRAGCSDENGMAWSEELVEDEWRVLKVTAKDWDDPIYNRPPADDVHEVHVSVDGAQVFVPVSLGSNFAYLLLDTGCTSMTVTKTAATNLTAANEAVYDVDEDVTLANGATERQKTIRIKEVAIGKHVLHDVRAAVTPDGADMLLGFGVLNQISPKFSIDATKSWLIFDAEADPASAQQPTAPKRPADAAPGGLYRERASDECSYLHARLLERNAAAEQAAAAFMQFEQSYGGPEVIARNPSLWAQAQMLDQRARGADAAQLATAQAMLADHCVASGDLPRFRNWVATMRSFEAILPGGLTP